MQPDYIREEASNLTRWSFFMPDCRDERYSGKMNKGPSIKGYVMIRPTIYLFPYNSSVSVFDNGQWVGICYVHPPGLFPQWPKLKVFTDFQSQGATTISCNVYYTEINFRLENLSRCSKRCKKETSSWWLFENGFLHIFLSPFFKNFLIHWQFCAKIYSKM